MNDDVKMFISGAIVLIALYLVVVNWQGFAKVVSSISGGSAGIIGALQGRGGSGFGSLPMAA